jgi:hypothetical protein
MENIPHRIDQLIKNEGLSIRKMESVIGCSEGVLSKSIHKGTDIGSKWLSKIIQLYPKYSAEWLLVGAGDMVKTVDIDKKYKKIIPIKEVAAEPFPKITVVGCPDCIDKLNTINDLRNNLDDLRKHIDLLELNLGKFQKNGSK